MRTLFLILTGLFFTLSSIAKPLNSTDSLRVKAWNFILGGEGSLQDLERINYGENTGAEKILCELKVLKNFVESFNFDKMKENRLLNYTNNLSKTNVKSFCEPGKQYAFYLFKDRLVVSSENEAAPRGYRDKIIFQIPEGSYRADWIDPQKGNTIHTEYFSVKKDKHSLNTPSYYMDLALKIIRIL